MAAADNVHESVVGEVFLKLTLGEVVSANGVRNPAIVSRTVQIKGKDIETRGLSGAAIAALNQARDELAEVVAE